ncbi:hypothetical protein LQZ18_05935 [Lachnospiraceae bacterium ZAX-1]
MNNLNMLGIFDVIIAGYGIYMIYESIKMKKTGIPGNWLMGNTDITNCKDLKGFTNYMYKKTFLFGVLAIAYGILGGINNFVYDLKYLYIACLILFLLSCVWITVSLNKGKKMFL